MEAFEEYPAVEVVFQALTPTITANGVAVAVGGGKLIGDRAIMLRVGVGLLDRETGVLRSFVEGREESIAVTTVTPTGSICTANSPVRRASGKALYPADAEGIIGGISCYKPVRNDLLIRDATCAAGVRARNAAKIQESAPASAAQDVQQIAMLIEQSREAVPRGLSEGSLDESIDQFVLDGLASASAHLADGDLARAGNDLVTICSVVAQLD